jgi:HTH-type transcriptional regulator/antitoxin HigA
MSAASTMKSPAPGKRYMDLIRRFPLRPIRTKVEAKAATTILDRLFGVPASRARGVDHGDVGEADYVRVLAHLLADYEATETAAAKPASGLDVLHHLMDANGMKQMELAAVLGIGAPAVSMILAGTRPLTADHARSLAARFAVDPGLFL